MCIESAAQRGVTLIEQIIFIVIMAVGVMGLVTALTPMMRASADPMQTKQMAAIAESLLSEVLHQPFTWCDPDDANASTASSYAGCAAVSQQALAPTAGEARDGGGGGVFFDNVVDYSGFAMDNISDPSGTAVMTGFRGEVAIVQDGVAFGLAADEVLAITVTVCRTTPAAAPCAGRDAFALTGYRFRYAPRI